MSNRIFKITSLLIVLSSSALHAAAQQPSRFDDLEKHLNQKMIEPDAIKFIKAHLDESGTTTPLDNLVAWAKAGFPDMHDEHGIWKTDAVGLWLGVVISLHYYFSTSPPADTSRRYLAVMDELQSNDYITFHLADMAHLVVDEAVLEKKVLQLLETKDPKLRAQGIQMGTTLAERKVYLFERYKEMVQSDEDVHVRLTALSSMDRWRRKDVALIAFDRLLNDTDANVRDRSLRGLLEFARRRVLTDADLSTILPPILKTSEPSVRTSIAHLAARVTTDRSLGVRGDKISDEVVAGFIRSVKERESSTGSAVSGADLAKLWMEWWIRLIPEYTVPKQLVH